MPTISSRHTVATATAGIALCVAFPLAVSTSNQQPVVLREAWRVGAESGGSILFDDILDFDVDKSGTAYVLDDKHRRIVVIDSSGRVVHTMGRQGAGPGEMEDPSGIAVAPDGSVWVQDRGNGRYLVFDAGGTPTKVYSFRPTSTSYPWSGVFLDSGELVDQRPQYAATDDEYGKILVQRPGDRTVDAHDSLALGNDPPRQWIAPPPYRVGVVPMSATLRFAIAPQGFFWIANTAEFRVRRVGLDGKTLATIERRVAPLPVPRKKRDDVSDMFKKQGITIPPGVLPTKLPVIGDMIGARDGSVWVSLSDTTSKPEQRYERYDASGRQLPTVILPSAQSYPGPIVTSRGVWTIIRSDDGVPTLIRYRLP